MRAWVTGFWLLASVAWPGTALAQGSPQQVYAIVVDSDGWPVRGLGSEDFSLRDGSVRQAVVGAEPATSPLWIAIVVRGFEASDRPAVRRAIDAIATTVRSQAAGSHVGVMRPRASGGSEWLDVTSGVGENTLDATTGPSGSLTDSIDEACSALRAAPTDRRAVITLLHRRSDDGVVSMNGLLTDALFQASAALWTVEVPASSSGAPAQGPAAPARGAKLDDVLTEATAFSGALRERVADAAGLEPMATRVARLLLAQYIVTYLWPNPMLSQFSIATRHDRGDVLVPAWAR